MIRQSALTMLSMRIQSSSLFTTSSKNDAKELTITDDMIKNATLRADLIPESSSKHTELKDGKISVPPQSTVIIKSAE